MQTPQCCDSGFYTLDECGCCLTCAKPEGAVCGGPFRIAGQCAAGLRCLRQCGQSSQLLLRAPAAAAAGLWARVTFIAVPDVSTAECKSVTGADCVFPFTYKGQTYKKCTTADSDNGAAWCATEVNPLNNEVVENKWQDCQEGCPGTDFVCNDGFLFNEMGSCVNGNNASDLLRFVKQNSDLAAVLDDIPSGEQKY